MGGVRWGPLHLLRRRLGFFFVSVVVIAVFTIVLLSFDMSGESRANQVEQELAGVALRVQFMESLYRARQEEVFSIEGRLAADGNNSREPRAAAASLFQVPVPAGSRATKPTLPPQLAALLKNMTGSHTANGFKPENLVPLKMPLLAYHLLPHLLRDHNSLRPSFHIRGGRSVVDVVIGIPSVQRDKESYLAITLTQLVEGLSAEDAQSTLIVVFLGETDPEYIMRTAKQIEAMFPKHLDSGLIELLAPSQSFYPDFDAMHPTLGDPAKRFKWRTKQNLDNIFLMTYCQPRGTFYLMLEDDIIAKRDYIKEIKKFAAATTIVTPHWIVLEFCRVGGIGKLFKSADLLSFITYVQLFYTNLPIDWLIESYLADKVCTIEKNSKQCIQSKLEIRPRYQLSLFQHIGLYSSLSGKIQKLKDTHFGAVPQFIAHINPPLAKLHTTIEEYSDHTLRKAYEGKCYFWGLKPKAGDVMEFTFETPMHIGRYKFRSGSVEHVSDKLYSTSVQVHPVDFGSDFVTVGQCDDQGLCEGSVDRSLGKIDTLRLYVQKSSEYWVIISEILISEKRS